MQFGARAGRVTVGEDRSRPAPDSRAAAHPRGAAMGPGSGSVATHNLGRDRAMNARIGVVAGVLLAGAGAVAWAQSPGERAEEVARLKAKVESAELAREADRE